MLAMGALDLLVRNLDEVRAVQDLSERVDQIPIGAFDCGVVEAALAVGVGTEIEVVVAQPLELIEILIVIDRAEQAAKLAELFPLRLAAERAIRDDRVEDVDLAGGNEMVPLTGAACRLVHHACGRPAATGLYSIVTYSIVTLADLITAPQRSVSSLTILAMFAGVPPTAVRCIRA